MRARKTAIVVLLFAICLSFMSAYAHDDHDHYKEMEAVILGNNAASVMGDASRKRMVRHLEYATSIALDQFNGSKKTLLLDLQLFEVPELPARITDTIDNGSIDFSAS